MKKIISIITAMSIAMMTMLSAITVSAAEKITADEVKEMIYSSGLKAYPELWDKTIKEYVLNEDVLNPKTKTVKDVLNITNTYRHFLYQKTSDGYTIKDDDTQEISFTGFNKDGKRIRIEYCPENYEYPDEADTVMYWIANDEYIEDENDLFVEDYKQISKIINDSNIGEISDIKIVRGAFLGGLCVYIENNQGINYAIPSCSYIDDISAPYLGREVKEIKKGEIISFDEWCDKIDTFEQNSKDDRRTIAELDPNVIYFEPIVGDEIRDTDTRSAYIGTESKFSDVSGDLISYVNELADMGIISGYGENMFMPENNITRAEAASMLARMLKYSGTYSGEFEDVSADDWFANDVSALTAAGIINGYNETIFAPYENIKYQEVMKILVYALGYEPFCGSSVNAYPLRTNERAMEMGLTNGLTSFDTTAPITRGDMAIMLSNALDTHMFTFNKQISGNGIDTEVGTEDITLIDYLNGGKLNGTLSFSQFD